MALILPRTWCLIFFRDPEAQFTPAKMKKLLQDRGLTVEGDKDPFTVRWRDGPVLSVSMNRGKPIEAVAKQLVGRQKKFQPLVPGCDSQIKIAISDLDETLDEINTLIEVQLTLQSATGGLMYNGWNQALAGPD